MKKRLAKRFRFASRFWLAIHAKIHEASLVTAHGFFLRKAIHNGRAGCVTGDIDRCTKHIKNTVDTKEDRQRIDRDLSLIHILGTRD